MTEERKPNKPLIREWVEALRSGAYEQGKFRLRKNDKFCCLGVVCDIYGKHKGIAWKDDTFLEETRILPQEVLAELGLKSMTLPHMAEERNASKFNDLGVTFTEIAAAIEEEYLKCPV